MHPPSRPGFADAGVASCALSVTHLTRCAPSRARRLLGTGRRGRALASRPQTQRSCRRLAEPSWATPPPVGHLLQGDASTSGFEQRFGQLLLFLDDRLPEIAVFGDAREDLRRVEHEQARVLLLQTVLDLGPRHRRGHCRPGPGPQRVHVPRPLLLAVLAPAAENATGPTLL